MLCPRIVRIATVAVLREESACRRIIEPRIHILEPSRFIRNAPRERHLVEERIAHAGRLAELVVVVGLDDRALTLRNRGAKLRHALYAPKSIGQQTNRCVCLSVCFSIPIRQSYQEFQNPLLCGRTVQSCPDSYHIHYNARIYLPDQLKRAVCKVQNLTIRTLADDGQPFLLRHSYLNGAVPGVCRSAI